MRAVLRSNYFSLLINGALFYLGWFFCVTNAAANRPYLGLVVAIAMVTFHLFMVREKIKELILIFAVVIVGFFVETGMITFRILEFSSPNTLLIGYAPFWVLGIYALFAITVNHSLSWLQPYLFLAAWLGCLGGMFSYAVGQRIGAVTFLAPKGGSLLFIGIVWFILMPVIYTFNGVLTKYFPKSIG